MTHYLHLKIPEYSVQAQSKVPNIKAIRVLSGLGLKEAKDISDRIGEYRLPVDPELFLEGGRELNAHAREQIRVLRQGGIMVGSVSHEILEGLRGLASEALRIGDDELANEILQLVLAEKMKRDVFGQT